MSHRYKHAYLVEKKPVAELSPGELSEAIRAINRLAEEGAAEGVANGDYFFQMKDRYVELMREQDRRGYA